MPYEIYHQPFGLLTEYFIQNTETGEYASILPAHGAIVRKLILRKADQLVSVICAPESPRALLTDETYASALLYPFPSRIRHGMYLFDGVAHTLPINETASNHAIHGFVAHQPFELVRQHATEQEGALTLRYCHDGSYPGYPFSFTLQVTYTLSEIGLTVHYEAQNTGMTTSPVAFGWHPYFTLNEEPIDQLTIDIPSQREVILDKDLIAEGEQPIVRINELGLHGRKLDNCFIVDASETDTVSTILRSTRQLLSLKISQEIGPGKFNYLVIYTPPKRNTIAIEPLTSNVNAFNNRQGLIQLQPQEIASGIVQVALE